MSQPRVGLRERAQLAADAALAREGGPLRPGGRWLRVAPFAIIAGLALLFGLLPGTAPDGPDAHPEAVVAALVTAAVLVAVIQFVPWQALPVGLQGLVPFLLTIMVFFLRHAEGAGDAGYSVLYLLPVIWVALFSPGWQVVAMLVWVALLISLPPVLDGPVLGEQHYLVEDYRLSVIIILITVMVAGLLRFVTTAAALDPLTGLPNRRVFMANLNTRAALAARAGEPLTAGMIDLDHFKAYNDSNGHDAGDDLLRRCAVHWRAELRDHDLLGRVGGEEFGIILDGAPDATGAPTSRLLGTVPEGQTASIGVAVLNPGDDPMQVLRMADDALYDAKHAGRARIVMAGAPAG